MNWCSGFALDATARPEWWRVTHSHALYRCQKAVRRRLPPLHLLACFFAEMFLFSGSLKARASPEAAMDPRSASAFLNSDLMSTTAPHKRPLAVVVEQLQLLR